MCVLILPSFMVRVVASNHLFGEKLFMSCMGTYVTTVMAMLQFVCGANIETGFALQMMEVLIVISNVVSRHPDNKNLLACLAQPLTQALASILVSLPSNPTVNPPEAAPCDVSSHTGTPAQTDSAALPHTQIGWHCQTSVLEPAADDSSARRQMRSMSALTAHFNQINASSMLTAQLKGKQATPANTPQQSLHETHTASKAESPQHPEADNSRTFDSAKSSDWTERKLVDSSQKPETPQPPELTPDSNLTQKAVPIEGDGLPDPLEVQLARRFTYHVLLHLPAASLEDRQGFWVKHAVGLPELMQCCVEVAVMQSHQVSPCLVKQSSSICM